MKRFISIFLALVFTLTLMNVVTPAAKADDWDYDTHAWQSSAEDVDFLVISMHPDDDTLFMGAIMPIYGVDQGYNGTILYMSANERRTQEALSGAWTMGLRTYPYFAGMRDVCMKNEKLFNESKVIKVLVRYFRMLRPEVVITHDTNGEYGHWQHKVVAAAAQKAVKLAADPSYDPQSANEYGIWQVQKLYLHLYKENKIVLDVTTPLESLGNRSAWEVAQEAFLCHKSQQNGHHYCDNSGVNDLSKFGLAFSTVGADTGNDMFENVRWPKALQRDSWDYSLGDKQTKA